ncbi:hypothetical protein QOT17_024509 [Balamuthia mandrillaris]
MEGGLVGVAALQIAWRFLAVGTPPTSPLDRSENEGGGANAGSSLALGVLLVPFMLAAKLWLVQGSSYGSAFSLVPVGLGCLGKDGMAALVPLFVL